MSFVGTTMDPRWLLIAQEAGCEPAHVWTLFSHLSELDSAEDFDPDSFALFAFCGGDRNDRNALQRVTLSVTLLDIFYEKGLINRETHRLTVTQRNALRPSASAARQRRYRERLRERGVTQRNALRRDVTHRNALRSSENGTNKQNKQITEKKKKNPPSGVKKKKNTTSTPTQTRGRKAPQDWQPNEAHVQLAKDLGVPLDEQVAMFRDHEFVRPKSDWDATFRNWLRMAANMNGNGARRPAVRPGGTLAEQQYGEGSKPGGARFKQ